MAKDRQPSKLAVILHADVAGSHTQGWLSRFVGGHIESGSDAQIITET